jgi:DNA-binding LytR/AlgR family response regulator
MSQQTTAYGWIDPQSHVIHVKSPEQLITQVVQHEPQLTRLFNITHTRDDAFWLALLKQVYQRGYIRFCKSGDTLALEAADLNAFSLHTQTIETIRQTSRCKRMVQFDFGSLGDPARSRERARYFPRH